MITWRDSRGFLCTDEETIHERPITQDEINVAHTVHDIVSNDKGSLGIVSVVSFNPNQYDKMRVQYTVSWMVKNNDEHEAWFFHDELINKGNVLALYLREASHD